VLKQQFSTRKFGRRKSTGDRKFGRRKSTGDRKFNT
jgi:hypothetical protein